jgi:ABC-type uncharacterized transport system ATPase subunit
VHQRRVNDVTEFCNIVERLRTRCAVLLIEHNMRIVLGISDHVTVMSQGRVLCAGTPQEVRHDPLVRDAYLGGARQHAERVWIGRLLRQDRHRQRGRAVDR